MLVPHEGPWSGVLRMHLGVDIPTDGEGCTLSVRGEQYQWKDGEVVVFDDTYEHFAINLTDHPRVVLFMDYMRPLPWPLHALNKFCIYIGRFFRITRFRLLDIKSGKRSSTGRTANGVFTEQHSTLQVLGAA